MVNLGRGPGPVMEGNTILPFTSHWDQSKIKYKMPFTFARRFGYTPRRNSGFGRTSNRRFSRVGTTGGRRFWPYRRYTGGSGLTPQEHKENTVNVSTVNPFDTGVVLSTFTLVRY